MKPLQLLHTKLPAGGNTEVGGRDQKTILWSSNVQTLFRNSKQTIRTPPEGRTGGGGLLLWLTMSVRFFKRQLQTKVFSRRVPLVRVRGIGLVFCVDWLTSQFEYFGRAGAGPERSSSNMSRSPHLRPEMAWSLVSSVRQFWHQCKTMLHNFKRSPLLELFACWIERVFKNNEWLSICPESFSKQADLKIFPELTKWTQANCQLLPVNFMS